MAEKAVYAILSGDSNTSTTATGGIFADVVEQGQSAPFVVYRLTDVSPEPTKDGASDFDKYELEVASITKSEEGSDTLAGYVKTALNDYSGTAGGVVVSGVVWQEKRGYYDEDSELFIREQDFEIIVKP